ncbi:STAS domain-containing protein [Streptosporangium sp. NPDC001681]|uniref:STAS domain-containing protein n=1 Tax=Streptosporangium sp. NPDC001681 TaxID=3154395 RepID=UPI00332411F8
MPPEGVNALSVSTGAYEGAIVVRAIGELDYDYAPVFRRELARFWGTSTDGSPLSPPPLLPENPPSPSPLVPPPFETAPGTRAEAAPLLILDLAGLTFCDSTGLAELLWILRQSQEARTRLVVTGVSRTLRHMLATTGLLSYFTMAASVEEALLAGETGTAEG